MTINKNTKYENLDKWFFYLFIVFYSGLIVFLSYKLTIWEDEAYTLNTTSNKISDVFYMSYLFEGQPPFYFLILSLWRIIDSGIFFARLLSVFFIFLSSVYLYKYLLLKNIYSKWVIVLFLLNPFTVWAALEIRTYSLLILLSIILFYYFEKIRYTENIYNRLTFIIIGIISVYTQYYFVFYLLALSLIILFIDGRKKFFTYCFLNIPIAIFFTPNFICIYDQFIMHQDMQIKALSYYEQLSLVSLTPQQFLLSITGMELGRVGRWILRLLFLVVSIITLNKLIKSKSPFNITLLYEIVIPITTIYLIFTLIFLYTNMLYSDKYASIIFPIYIIIYSFFGVLGSFKMNLISTIISIYFLFILVTNYKEPFIKRDNNRAAIAFIKNKEHNNEPIVCFDKHTYLEVKNYYNGINKLVSAKELVFDYNFYKNQMNDTLEFKLLLKSKTDTSQNFWLISGTDIEFVNKKYISNQMLDEFILNNFSISIDTTILGKYDVDYIRVRKLTKKNKF